MIRYQHLAGAPASRVSITIPLHKVYSKMLLCNWHAKDKGSEYEYSFNRYYFLSYIITSSLDVPLHVSYYCS